MGITREMAEGVRFDDFAAVAKKAGWDEKGLAELFTGKIDGPTDLFRRIFAGNPAPSNGRSQWDSVIPYASVIAKYCEMRDLLAQDGRLRKCACGCGRPVTARGQSRVVHRQSDSGN